MYQTLLSTIFLIVVNFCNAQEKTYPFALKASKVHAYKSIYSSIQFLDSRTDKSDLGYLLLLRDLPLPVIPMYPLEDQINNLFDSSIANILERNSLLFQLKKFTFSETLSGYCSIRAQLYSKNDSGYKKIAFLDTNIVLNNNGIFSTKFQKKLLTAGNDALAQFVGKSLSIRPAENINYTIDEVMNIDSVEKRKITLYKSNVLKDGLYRSYQSFKNQIPDDLYFQIKERNGEVVKIEKYSGEELIVISPSEIYAVVYKGKPYITNDFGFYPLKKVGDDFYFVGKEYTELLANSFLPLSNALSISLGIAGQLFNIGKGGIIILIKSTPKATFIVKVDYVNGEHILLNKVE